MAEKAYQCACERAELFGQDKPDREEFMEKNKYLDLPAKDEGVFEEISLVDDKLAGVTGGVNEINSILGSTQTKLNRIKGACSSLTNMLRFKLTGSKSDLSYSSAPSYVGQMPIDSNPPTTSDEPTRRDISHALQDLKDMQELEDMAVCSRATANDMGKAMTSQINKLDSLLNKAEYADAAMQHQNKQMRSFLR